MLSRREVLCLAGATGVLQLAACASTSRVSSAVKNDLAPTSKLRAGINYGNVILAIKDDKTGELRGVHVDLAVEMARRLGVPVQLIGYAAAVPLVDGLKKGELDIALLSAEPARAGEINFSPSYVEIDATYLVPPNSPFRNAAELDREGVRIVIAARSVYEFHLNRVLKHAKLTNAPSTHAAFELFAKQKLDALVGLRPRLAVDAQMMPGSRIVDGRFMVVEQAICTPKQRDDGTRYVRNFTEDVKASGWLARSMQRHGVQGVAVAPLVK